MQIWRSFLAGLRRLVLSPASGLLMTVGLGGFACLPAPEIDPEVDGLGSWAELATSPDWADGGQSAFSAVWCDWDRDGDLDLLVGLGNLVQTWRNDGGALSFVNDPGGGHSDATGLAVGDVDGDDVVEVLVAESGGSIWMYAVAADGSFSDLGAIDSGLGFVHSVALGDWDADGDLDLAAGHNGGFHLYRNNSGLFADVFSTTGTAYSVAWADRDGDGDLELAVGGEGIDIYDVDDPGPNVALYASSASYDIYDLSWGVWEASGLLDLAAARSTSGGVSSAIYSVGDGLVTEVATTSTAQQARSSALGDLNGDGDVDWAIGSFGPDAAARPDRLFYNDGGSPLVADWTSSAALATWDTQFADWDLDGDLDLLVARSAGSMLSVYSNDLVGPPVDWQSTETQVNYRSAWGDWDGDGDLDLVVANSSLSENRVYANEDGSLSLALPARDAP